MTLIFDPATPDDIRLAWIHTGTQEILRDVERQALDRIREHHGTAHSLPFVKAAQIVASHWSNWGPKLLADDKRVDIDLTSFADEPNRGEGGEHILWINAILVMLSARSEEWAQPWMPGRRWIARFGPRRKNGGLAIPHAGIGVVTRQ